MIVTIRHFALLVGLAASASCAARPPCDPYYLDLAPVDVWIVEGSLLRRETQYAVIKTCNPWPGLRP